MADKIKIAGIHEVPKGQGKQIELPEKGLSLGLFNVDGSYYVMNGVCSHVGGPLGEGDLDGNVVICPWHGWAFDVMTGNCAGRPGLQQTCYPVSVSGEDIFVEV